MSTPVVRIEAALAAKVTFASHQNAVPLVQSLRVVNTSDMQLEGLDVTIASDPSFLAPKSWRVDRLAAGGHVEITDRDTALNGDVLLNVRERLAGSVILSVRHNGAQLAELRSPVEVLARNEWGGAGAMPELLAAFVTPNDPAVDAVLKNASRALVAAGKSGAIDGYETPERSWELASAIWSAIASTGLTYALPPASFETAGQKIRTPGDIAAGRVATCLDGTLLFAAALEQAGLNPLVILVRGHAFAGVWLQKKEFDGVLTRDAAALRKRIDLNEIVAFETTLAMQSPPATFSAAIKAAEQHLRVDEKLLFALDVRRARMQRIRPLALEAGPVIVRPQEQTAMALEEAPSLTVPAGLEPKPTTPQGRIDAWQRKLLDLTTRNRLLNAKPSATMLRLVCPDPAKLEDLLAADKKIKIVAAPALETPRDGEIHKARTGEDLTEAYARDALERGEVLSPLAPDDLDETLVDLYRKARLDLAEGGSNTLFLAVGFLRWKKDPKAEVSYRAPLVLLPVTLERKSALSGVRLSAHEDEPRFNLTLLQLLKQDFELSIPELEGELPVDASGVDVPLVWTTVKRAVKEMPGFEVVDEIALGTFSFAKYLMWKDLVDRTSLLKQSPLVAHLIDTPREQFYNADEFPKAGELDRAGGDLYTPLPADSSQLTAVVASARGQSFVLDGPPGTGKSQTISNIIAHNLGLGRKVLFVAEKMAALDVVHRRLEERGLGTFCLELHSAKANKTEVLKQLERAWDTQEAAHDAAWSDTTGKVAQVREELNALVSLLHTKHANGFTIHHAIGLAVRDKSSAAPVLAWPMQEHDAAAMERLRDAARRLDVNYAAVAGLNAAAFGLIDVTEWSNAWQAELVNAAQKLAQASDLLAAAGEGFTQALGLGSVQLTTDVRNGLGVVARGSYREAEKHLSVPYTSVRELPIAALTEQWALANASWWPLSFFKRGTVRKALMTAASLSAKPDLGRDLPLLTTMQADFRLIDTLQALIGKPIVWSETPAAKAYIDATEAFATAQRDFERAANSGLPAGAVLTEMATHCRTLVAGQGALKSWCDWQRARGDALHLGLAPFVEGLLKKTFAAGMVAGAFEVAYATWWAGLQIDAHPRLRNFVAAEHEGRITTFRKLDDALVDLASQVVRARVCKSFPRKDDVKRESGYGVLRHELTKKRQHKPVRQLLREMGPALATLTPCLLMSPLSVAQYLPADAPLFDLVIFDEASQITTWDAVGAMARGKQVIIAGDPKQMPPTSFFTRGPSASAEDDPDDVEDMESILDECLGASIPRHRLTWHYRSRHESLIAFSNHRYYDGDLITFPAPVTRESAVSLRRVNGLYARSKGRTNPEEAKSVVAEVVARLTGPFGAAGKSLAVITLNGEQQGLIEDLLDAERRTNPALEPFFAEDRRDPVIVKNLETIQGDERDLILLSIGYGPDTAGATTMSMNFGPLNRQGGWRRLNVAITRAREETIVFASFGAEMIDLSRTSAQAVRDLKQFLEFAERGPRALAVGAATGTIESPLEEAVARGLRSRGWTVTPQIGVSRFRLDLGVVHPSRPDDYLCAVECDGATYANAATARDRDKVRTRTLGNLGWKLLRVWATDWWVDPAGALDQLDAQLRALAK